MVESVATPESLARLDLFIEVIITGGALPAFMAWRQQEKARPGYTGYVSGEAMLEWLRAARPDLYPLAYAVTHDGREPEP
jgi:hypothetical protein